MAKIAFVQHLEVEYLGVMYLSAMLRQHAHKTEVFIGSDSKRLVEEVRKYGPDLVGFSCSTGLYRWCLHVAQEIKKVCPAKIIFGGPHPTFNPEIIEADAVDIVCRGEGEHALLDIATGIDQKRPYENTLNCWFSIEGSVVKNEVRPLVQDLGRLPFPDRSLYEYKYPGIRSSRKAVIAGRGCSFDCSYCFNKALKEIYRDKGAYVRKRSVADIIEEIDALRSRDTVKTIYFQDDSLFYGKEWLREFSASYKQKVGLPYICSLRVENIDEDTVRLLKESNCRTVFFGIESGAEELRFACLKRQVTDARIIEAAGLLKKYHIRFRTYNMLGLPGETVADAFKTVKINTLIGTDYPWCSLLYPFPGTEMRAYVQERNLLDERKARGGHISFFKTSVVRSEHGDELANLQKLFFFAVKFPALATCIKRLIKLRPNFLFDMLFLISYGWIYYKSENFSLAEVIGKGVRNVSRFYGKSA